MKFSARETLDFAVFLNDHLLQRGDLETAAKAAHANSASSPLVFESASGRVLDLDLRGSWPEVASRLWPAGRAKPVRGRPRLGVIPREVTLLPRHWDWLSAQPGGASAALRRLVDQARKDTVDADARRQAQEAAYRVATTLAGNRPGYEEAIRALFANDMAGFHRLIDAWPPDIAGYLRDLTASLAEPS